jgi:PAS domain S-box-containing protein
LQLRNSLPPILRFAGGVYVLLSGAILLLQRPPVFLSVLLWAATAGLGLLAFGTGTALRRIQLPPVALHWLASGMALAFVLHGVGYAWVMQGAGNTAYLFTLLVASGYVLPNRWAVAGVLLVGLGAWLAAAATLGLSALGSESTTIYAGLVVATLAHIARHRHLVQQATRDEALQSSLTASEERFRGLAEAAQDAILLVDGGGRIRYLNPAGLRLFGLSSQESAGSFLSQLVRIGELTPNELVGTREVEGLRRDGTTFPAELSLARMNRVDGGGYTGILRDIADRKQAAAARQAAASREVDLAQLRRMNEFKTRFLNMAAHELNTPLTPLRLQLHLLKAGQMGNLNERQAKAIALLDRNVARLSSLVAEILDVARLQSGRLRISVHPVGVDDVVDEVIESFAETARGVKIDLRFAGQQSLVVMADRNRLTQVLFNLISNALKFTGAGGTVTVSAQPVAQGVQISVQDTGMGMTKEQMERLFQPFVQVHDPMSITASGTGLGLYICKGLIEGQHGEIAVESQGPGRGSAFHITLPGSSGSAPVAPASATGEDPLVQRLRELI